MNDQIIIKQDGVKKRKLASSQFNITDIETGEVLKFIDNTVEINYKTDEHFIKFYIDNLGFISNVLTEIEKKVFYSIITFMNYYNIVTLNSDIKKNIAYQQKIGKSSVYKAIEGLISKQVILLIDDEEIMEQFGIITKNNYLVNPNLVGKAGFKDMNKIRKIITIDYDRDRKRIIQNVETFETSREFEKVLENKQDYKLINIDSNEFDKNIQNTITIENKDEENTDFKENYQQDDYEKPINFTKKAIEISKTQNKSNLTDKYLQSNDFKDSVKERVGKVLKLETELLKERLALREYYLEIGDIEKASLINLEIR